MWKEFKNFITRGNVVSIAIGIIIGAAFNAIVNSLVSNIIMPPVGLVLGKVDFTNLFVVLKQGATAGPYMSFETAKADGAVTLNYGVFINTVISFLIIAIVLFFIIKAFNALKKKEEPVTKTCPYCFTLININATRCQSCTSELK